MLMGTDPTSWVVHSPNIMCARRSIAFEEGEYRRARMDLENSFDSFGPSVSSQRKSYHHNTTETRKNRERYRLYEFVVEMFQEHIPNHQMLMDGGYEVIKCLKTVLKECKEGNETDDDPLKTCISNLMQKSTSDSSDDEQNDHIDDTLDNTLENTLDNTIDRTIDDTIDSTMDNTFDNLSGDTMNEVVADTGEELVCTQ